MKDTENGFLSPVIWHAVLLAQALALAGSITLAWKLVLWDHGIRFPDRNEGILVEAVLAILGINFVVSVAQLHSTLQEKSRMMSGYLLGKDIRSILKMRDERMPVVLVVFQLTMSFFLVSTACLISYSDPVIGAYAVFILSAIVSLAFIVVLRMQDPTQSPWLKRRLDRMFPGWESVSIDDYFETHTLVEDLTVPRQAGKK